MSDLPKLSYFHNIGKHPLRALTLGNLLEMANRKFGDREAIISIQQKQRLTYRNLFQTADNFAAGLHAIGLKKGDRLGLCAPNMVEWYVVNMACVRAGILMAAINPGSQATELEYYINKVGIKTIVCPQKAKHQDYYHILTKILPELKDSCSRKINNCKVPTLDSIIIISDERLSGTFAYKEILDFADKATVSKIRTSQHLIQPDDACYIQFSSGTTGQPKAAVASHFQVVNNSFEIGRRNELDQKHHKICMQVPFFHVFGTTVTLAAALNFGATIVVGSPTYDPLENLKALNQEKCTSVYGTPTMYVDLISLQRKLKMDISPEIAVSGGAACSPELFKQIREILNAQKIKSVFGLTEVTAVAFQSLALDEDEFKINSTVGHIGDHLEAKIIDGDNNIVPIGTPGELCIRGYSTMLAYWQDKEKTEQTITPDGWLRTGDQFILQEDGYGRILGRLKDIIIRGGENIFPKEIEDFLNTHPDILETHVIGLRHERLGEEVCACVRLKEGSKLTQKLLLEFCKGKMTFSKIPSQLRIVQDFPKTTSGKIKKYQLRKQFDVDNVN